MKYKFCGIRKNVTKYDVTFSTKGELTRRLLTAQNDIEAVVNRRFGWTGN